MTVEVLRSKPDRSVLTRLIITALTAACCGMAFPVLAQEADDTMAEYEGMLEEVIVTGYRRSLELALDVKRDTVGVVDAIMAEDIADFPDTNLAESLQRIPGVAIVRNNGEGSTLTVRGLGSRFTMTRINGMETRASAGTTRGFDFNIFAAELFNSIVVRKTATADVQEGSLGSMVDLNTGRAFAYKEGHTFLAGGQANYNDLSEEWGPRLTGLYAYNGDTWGVSGSVAYSEMDVSTATGNTVRWARSATFNSVLGVDCAENPTDAGCVEMRDAFHARIPRYGTNNINRDRLGLTAGFQWAPTERSELSVDYMYAKYDQTTDFKTIEVLLRSNEGSQDVTAYSIVSNPERYGFGNDTVISMDVDNAWVRSETYYRELDTKFDQLTATFEHEFSDAWSMNILLGSSNSERDTPTEATLMYDDRSYDGYSYDYSQSDKYPVLAFNGRDVNDGTIYQLTEVRDRLTQTDSGFDAARISFDWDFSDTYRLSAGYDYKKFDLSTAHQRRDGGVCSKGLYECGTIGDGTDEFGVPGRADWTDSFKYNGRVGAGSNTTWGAPNLDSWAEYFDLYSLPAIPRQGSTFQVKEKSTAWWTQLNGQHEFGNMNFLYNLGVRYVETDQTSSGFVSGTWATVDRPTYDDWLPSINAALWVTDNVVLRGAYADTISRPGLSNLSPGGSVDSFNFTVSYKNPMLDPTRSENWDFSVEWYFADEALLSLALFSKDIESFPINGTRTGTYESTGLPLSAIQPTSPASQNPEGTCNDPQGCWEISQLLNGPGAKLTGWEVAVQTPFGMLFGADVPVWRNMGFIANYTDVSSDVDYTFQGQVITERLLGLSENQYNFTIYYENDKFSTRISWAHRSDYLESGPNRTNNLWQINDGSTFVDFSSRYIFNDNWDMTFEILNLTDEKFSNIVDIDAKRRLNYDATGINYLLGVRYRF